MKSQRGERVPPRLGVEWQAFKPESLEKYLKLSSPPFTLPEDAFRQLRYVETYAGDLKCQALAIESHYIDRDHMEDHSVFYSKSLFPYANYCQRVHFFLVDVAEAKRRLKAIVKVGIQHGYERYRTECKQFSDNAYLGFAVIKPLQGSAVGRTVLRCFPEVPEEPQSTNQFRRDFGCARTYTAHFAGVELTVRGLAFQQQDVGVSACATTAIWTALQKTSDHEEIAAVTPVQITMLAAKYSLPYGRSMPSEGLSTDQMCQAVQSLGIAPNLFRAENSILARAYLYSALKSGFAPVLILSKPTRRHAVAVVGMKVKLSHEVNPVVKNMDDAANDLIGLYIHDDRRGPYLRTNLVTKSVNWVNPELGNATKKNVLHLIIPPRTSVAGSAATEETWAITHILIPMHAKIRLSFPGLRYVAVEATKTALRYRQTFKILPSELPDPTITIDTWIVRAHKYVESLFINKAPHPSPTRVNELGTAISLARYVGIVRLSASYFDPIDLVLDTTSTQRNLHCLAVVVVDGSRDHTMFMARYLAAILQCKLVQ